MDRSKYSEKIQNLIDEVDKNYDENTKLTLEYCDEIIEYGTQIEDNSLIGYAYYHRGAVYYVLNDGIHFFEAITNALAYLNKADEWELVARCYNLLGISAISRGNAAVALDYYLSAIKSCKKGNVRHYESTIKINIGSLDLECGRYEDAIESLKESYEYYSKHKELERYDDYMICIYQNIAKAYLCQGMLSEAKECFDRIYQDHKKACVGYTKTTVLCTEAMYYHIAGDTQNCEEKIALVDKETTSNMPIMDLFDDYYDYCKVLLDRKKEDEFWHVVELMEPRVKTLGITNLQLKVLALKIKFYRMHGMAKEFLQASGLYFELCERLEIENKTMMNGVLSLRRSLEKTKHEKQAIERENAILIKKSETDPLTKLNNRFRLNDYSEEAFQKAYDNGTTLTVEILDMDDFKGFNDYYGHQAGDECLVKIAAAIKSMEEHGAFVARYGGDEFILIYEGITKEQAVEYAAELRQKVMNLEIAHCKSKVADVMTITQGLCHDIPINNNRMWDFLHAADVLLYRVKGKARNNYCVGNLRMTEDQLVMSV